MSGIAARALSAGAGRPRPYLPDSSPFVGYDSPSQFSREYRRQFGAPPGQDTRRLLTTPAGDPVP